MLKMKMATFSGHINSINLFEPQFLQTSGLESGCVIVEVCLVYV